MNPHVQQRQQTLAADSCAPGYSELQQLARKRGRKPQRTPRNLPHRPLALPTPACHPSSRALHPHRDVGITSKEGPARSAPRSTTLPAPRSCRQQQAPLQSWSLNVLFSVTVRPSVHRPGDSQHTAGPRVGSKQTGTARSGRRSEVGGRSEGRSFLRKR